MNEEYSLEELELIYEQCLEVEEQDREAWLNKTCAGNDALKTAVLKLLMGREGATEYFQDLQQSLASGWTKEDIPAFAENEQVGKYRVKRLLGKGGMSNVYLAERSDGEFEQLVAIKCFPNKVILQQDNDVKKAEQKILAELQHPNIASLIDAGITESGVLYFIMEYVDGEALDEYLKRTKPDVSTRLALFKQVVETVAFAHSKFTLHLDLKPSNILINKMGKVKLLDFGIATQLNNNEQPQPGTFFGTPSIAAPEQFTASPLSTATDIYQLGILLHTMLVDASPVVGQSGSTEQLTRIKPSSPLVEKRVSSDIAEEPASIIKKCLEQEPGERYSSAFELLQDIERLEDGYPLTTMPNSGWYKLKKYVGRHQLQVISVSLIILSLAGGLAASLWQANQAKEQRDMAIQNQEVANVTKNFLTNLFLEAHPAKAQGDTLTVFQLLDQGRTQLAEYSGPAEVKLELLNTISRSYRSMGAHDKAKDVLWEARSLAQDSNITLTPPFVQNLVQAGLYQRDIGNNDSARLLLSQAINLYDKIGYPQQDSLYTDVLKRLGHVYKVVNNYDSATFLMKKTITLEEQIWPEKDNINLAESYYILASIYVDQRMYDEAIDYQKASLELCEKIMGTNFPGTMVNLNLLARILKTTGNYDEALGYNIRAKDIAINLFGINHSETATNMENLGLTHFNMSQYDSAYHYYNRALAIRNNIFENDQNNWHANTYNNLLSLFVMTEEYDSANYYLDKALNICASGKVSKRRCARTFDWGGELYENSGDYLRARDFYQKSRDDYSSYLKEDNTLVVQAETKVQRMDSLISTSP